MPIRKWQWNALTTSLQLLSAWTYCLYYYFSFKSSRSTRWIWTLNTNYVLSYLYVRNNLHKSPLYRIHQCMNKEQRRDHLAWAYTLCILMSFCLKLRTTCSLTYNSGKHRSVKVYEKLCKLLFHEVVAILVWLPGFNLRVAQPKSLSALRNLEPCHKRRVIRSTCTKRDDSFIAAATILAHRLA